MHTYDGYTGRVELHGDALVIVREGLKAKLTGQSQPIRRVPLAALSAVCFKGATRLVNGHLQFGFGGRPLPQLSGSTAASEPNTILFTHKQKDAFARLHEYLLHVVAVNESTGVHSAAVYAAAADPADGQPNHAAPPPGSQAEERLDIAEASARMQWKLGGGRELKKLPEHLYDGELVRFIAQGSYADRQGIVVLTDRRLLFLFHGLVNQAKEDFPLRSISSVQTASGMLNGELRVFVSGNTAVITGIVKGDLHPLADAVRAGISQANPPATAPAPTPEPAAASAQPDVLAQIQQLAQLHQTGVLNTTEFEDKKTQLLARL